MTKTEHLKLNVLERQDPLDRAALNQNAQALDAAITADRAAAAEEHSAVYGELGRLDGRADSLAADLGTHGHNCRMEFGSYVGDGGKGAAHPTRVEFRLRPMVVLVNGGNNSLYCTRGQTTFQFTGGSTAMLAVEWEEHAVSFYVTGTGGNAHNQMNSEGHDYFYFTLGYDPEEEEEEQEQEQE